MEHENGNGNGSRRTPDSPGGKDFVYFDLETQRTANDVGGWAHKDKMGMSVGVTFSTRLGRYTIYDESTVDELVDQLLKADLVVGFNHVGFDYHVLHAYTAWDLTNQVISCDLMVDLEQRLGHRLKLESVAAATLGAGKTADGLDAIKWWQEGRILDIARYCCYDVKVTRCVHEFGARHGFVRYFDRVGRLQSVDVEWAFPGPASPLPAPATDTARSPLPSAVPAMNS